MKLSFQFGFRVTHCYPFGLTMAGISSKAAGKLENKFKFNNASELQHQEFSDGSGLEIYDTQYRNLDPQTARWNQIDPKIEEEQESSSPYVSMGNNPILKNDPLGDVPDCDWCKEALQNFKDNISSAASAVVNTVVTLTSNLKDNIENERTLPQTMAADFLANPLSAITGTGPLKVATLAATSVAGTEIKVLGTIAKESESATKTFETYTKKGPSGEVYSGRTSGKAGPDQNVANRDANHHMNSKGFGKAQLDKSSMNKNAIRGREQQLIDKNGGAKSTGGTSGNAINGISDKNPKKAQYIEAAKKEFDKKN